jgi:hypothetical protein
MLDPAERLYGLLPEMFRQRDHAAGGALERIVAALAQTYGVLADSNARLYQQWFVETCEPWALPYIGALIGLDGRSQEADAIPTWRAYVANMLACQRRKGAIAALERAAANASGWAVHAVADVLDVATTDETGAGPLEANRSANLRDGGGLRRLGGAFDATARFADPAAPGPDPSAITLWIWRRQVYPVTRGAPRRVGPGQYTWDPFGLGRPMFHLPPTRDGAVWSSEPDDVPAPLGRAPLRRRDPETSARALSGVRDRDPDFELLLDGELVAHEAIQIADLGAWAHNWRSPQIVAALDPEFGRFLLRQDRPEDALRVSACYAAPDDIGGGPYVRLDGRREGFDRTIRLQDKGLQLAAVLQAWRGVDSDALVVVADSAGHSGDLVVSSAHIRSDAGLRRLAIAAEDGACPTLRGLLHIVGDGGPLLVQLHGLWLAGGLRLEGDVSVEASDCTIWPAIEFVAGSRAAAPAAVPGLSLSLKRCIVGAIAGPAAVSLAVEHSAVAGALHGPAVTLSAAASTFLGAVRAQSLARADDCIFLEGLALSDERVGPMRCSYAPTSVGAPWRQDCEPDLSIAAAPGAAREHAALRARPIFVSRQFGDPGFAELALETAKGITQGASNGYEMGCFNRSAFPLRKAALDEAAARFAPWDATLRMAFVT